MNTGPALFWRSVLRLLIKSRIAITVLSLLAITTAIARTEDQSSARSLEDRIWDLIIKGDVGDDRKNGETIYVAVATDADRILETLASFPEDDRRRIWRIDLSDKKFTDKSIKALSKFPRLKKLYVEVPWNEDLSPHLSCLPLTELYMPNCGVTGVSLEAIGKIETLEFLSIVGNPVKSGDFTPLKKLIAMRELHLDDTDLEDKDTAFLSVMPKLSLLGLNRTGVSDASIFRITNCSNLTLVRLVDTKITDNGYEKVRMGLPNAIIVHRTRE